MGGKRVGWRAGPIAVLGGALMLWEPSQARPDDLPAPESEAPDISLGLDDIDSVFWIWGHLLAGTPHPAGVESWFCSLDQAAAGDFEALCWKLMPYLAELAKGRIVREANETREELGLAPIAVEIRTEDGKVVEQRAPELLRALGLVGRQVAQGAVVAQCKELLPQYLERIRQGCGVLIPVQPEGR